MSVTQRMTDRLSYAFTAIMHAPRGTRTRDTRPAAAAHASRWPMFDFKDAHWTERALEINAPIAAPTCGELSANTGSCWIKYLNRIAQRGSCAVGFERTSSTPVPHSFDQSPLRRPVGRRQAGTRTVLLHRGVQDTCMVNTSRDEKGSTGPLAAAVAIGMAVKCVTTASSREHSRN